MWIKETLLEVKGLIQSCRDLKNGVEELQDAIPEVKAFQTDISKSVSKWQFKNQPRLDRINEKLTKMDQEQ
ncbi:MAG: hypothetical protein Q3959_05015 [Limosilactobacillus sp.]|uniref:hypothetical protein n=1 Tax=Limosilactobacillus sp. TaxID=2773925 RepID=UPI0027044F88|nr:hypothetical protein [Limosilactobacillus sp.]